MSYPAAPPPPPPSGLEVRDRAFVIDVVLTALLTLATVATAVPNSSGPAIAASLGMTLPLAFRRRLPWLTLVITVLSAFALLFTEPGGSLVVVAVPITVYSLARWAEVRIAHLALAAGLLGSVAGPIRWFGFELSLRASIPAVGIIACAGLVLGAYLLGRRRADSLVARRQQELAEAERLRLIAAEEEQRARASTVSERQRIARELHDIVAHSLSVIVVQAEGGRALTTKQPERAPEVLGTIAEAGREALEEMRRMVGLLRAEDGEAAALAPAPGLFDLPGLVQRSGVQARLEVHGAVPAVPPPLGLSAYRIVQESLTNVLKHAGPGAHALVRIVYRPEVMIIEVTDDGRGAASSVRGTGGGHGLRGMAERVGLHGGTLAAGPLPGPGFGVRAELPLREVR